MKSHIRDIILESTGATSCFEIETIQNLWSGYGRIIRIGLEGTDVQSVIIKYIDLSGSGNHPRGWDTDLSHQRKLKSYQVETNWYQTYAELCRTSCRIPRCYTVDSRPNEIIIVLEDLDAAGFPVRKCTVELEEVQLCLGWLANFHAIFLQSSADKLWEKGTYWHLDTRPDEWSSLTDIPLKNIAGKIDEILDNCTYMTLVHGDAKLANFCFSNDNRISVVDFQYVGKGCGMKDVVYLIGSCFAESDCEKYEKIVLDFYFSELREALGDSFHDFNELENEWRTMYPIAWTDFHRFLKGWSPEHWKINSYSEKLAAQVIKKYSNKQ